MTAPAIVPGRVWGRRAWAEQPAAVAPSARRFFLVHYDGGHPVLREGASVPRAIDAEHHRQGWAGIGYHFVVTQDGTVWEGRGWGLRGAHCPGRNTDGYGVQVAIGGDQAPTAAALRAVRALYDDACRLAGRTLGADDHGAHYPTDCAGGRLRTWVRSGMPVAPLRTPTEEDDVAMSDAQLDQLADRVADRITSIRARNPVLVAEGTGLAELPDGRDIDALPTVVGELQLEQARQGEVLDRVAALVETLVSR